MSLMHLLTVGKSFKEVKNVPTPYKIDERPFLPKFAPVGRPVSLAPRRAEPTATVEPSRAERPENLFALSAPNLGIESGAPSVETEKPKAAPVRPPEARPARFWPKFFGRRATAKGGRLVQAEMALEKVRVVRNDLQESDFELVPIRTRPEAARPHPTHPAEEQGSLWGRLVRRLSGGGLKPHRPS